MSPPTDLMERLRAAISKSKGEMSESAEYYGTSTVGDPVTAVGATVGKAVAGSLGYYLARHGTQVLVAALAGTGALGAAFMAKSLGQQFGLRHGTELGYVVLVAVSGIVAAVAVSAIDDDPKSTGLS